MIRTTLTTTEDIKEACTQTKEVFHADDDLAECCIRGLETGIAYTLRDSSENIGCIIGFSFYWRGVATVWAITTIHMDKYPIAYSRAIRRWIEEERQRFKVHRAEMTVKVGFPKALAWAKFLGFQEEGLLRQYNSDKTDSIILGRIW